MAEMNHETQPLKQIAIDYTPDNCTHCPISNTIALTYDHRGGARWRSPFRFLLGSFRAHIQCPSGDTSGLNFNLYLSTLEGDSSQDEIDFEFLGRDKSIVQTNYFLAGAGGKEMVHDLGFDCSDGFHEYGIVWGRDYVEWAVDGVVVRREENVVLERPMYLYSSVWDASSIDSGRWAGTYVGSHVPYVCMYKDVHVPLLANENEDQNGN